jgi:hypothetical protein
MSFPPPSPNTAAFLNMMNVPPSITVMAPSAQELRRDVQRAGSRLCASPRTLRRGQPPGLLKRPAAAPVKTDHTTPAGDHDPLVLANLDASLPLNALSVTDARLACVTVSDNALFVRLGLCYEPFSPRSERDKVLVGRSHLIWVPHLSALACNRFHSDVCYIGILLAINLTDSLLDTPSYVIYHELILTLDSVFLCV